ncbi:hypothetical protein [Nonomuraea basaltis]|uniref:hypothetical protein n=1 Tax=Nonomuraea basaltis TaxID=2495887 RepID=UPI00148623D3|nr:hypothetical protein [Nonomuraea basaltis]
MSGEYRPARTIQPGWQVRLATTAATGRSTGQGWMAVLARLDTVTDTGRRRVWFLGDGQAAVAEADQLVFSRTPEEAEDAAAADGLPPAA